MKCDCEEPQAADTTSMTAWGTDLGGIIAQPCVSAYLKGVGFMQYILTKEGYLTF